MNEKEAKMTEQIVIKLNAKKFKPILDKFIAKGCDTSRSYSEAVGKLIYWTDEFISDKKPRFDNKTGFEFLVSKDAKSMEDYMLRFISRYHQWTKD